MAADWCRLFGRRLADEHGEEVVILAGGIRGVALGVVLTALAQTVATGIALTAAGVLVRRGLTAVLVLCLAQVGPILVVLPAIIWLFSTRHTVSGMILVIIGVPAVLMDNFLRPVLIRRGADLPLLLIISGHHWRPPRLRRARPVPGPADPRRHYTCCSIGLLK